MSKPMTDKQRELKRERDRRYRERKRAEKAKAAKKPAKKAAKTAKKVAAPKPKAKKQAPVLREKIALTKPRKPVVKDIYIGDHINLRNFSPSQLMRLACCIIDLAIKAACRSVKLDK